MRRCIKCGAGFEGTWTCPACGFSPPEIKGFLAFAPELSLRSSSGFDQSEFEELGELEERYFWFRSRSRLIASVVNAYFSDARTYFEIGCGTGYVLQEVSKECPNLALNASEISVDGLPIAAGRTPRAAFYQMDAKQLPFQGEFDVIGAFDVLEHIDDDCLVLRQIHGALRNGGGMILTVPQHAFLWTRRDEAAGHFRRYGRTELVTKVREAGFEVVAVTSFVALLLPLLIASRLLGKSGADEVREFKIGRSANALLGVIMWIERLMIRAGLSFPAGGSLLLAARKG